MSRGTDTPAGASVPAGPVGRAWAWLVDGLAGFGTLLIGALMAIICADIVVRNLMGGSLPLVSELGALALVMIVYLQLATTIRNDRLVRADVFLNWVAARAPRLHAVLHTVYDVTGALVVATMAWATVTILERDIAAGQFIGVTGVLILPTWPFRALILFGIAVAAVQFAVQVVARWRACDGGTGAR